MLANRILISSGWPKSGKRFNNQIREHIYKMVDDAKEEILVSCYWFLDKQLALRILEKVKSGVEVKILLHNFDRKTKQWVKYFWELENDEDKKFKIYTYRSSKESKLHTKLIVTDSRIKSRARAYVGSANFTKAGFSTNIELGIGVEGEDAMEIGDLINTKLLKSAKVKEMHTGDKIN